MASACRPWFLVGAWLLAACGSPGSDAPADTDTTALPVVDSDTGDRCRHLSWATVGAPVVRTWCTPCHGVALRGDARSGAPVGVDFDTFEDVLRQAERVRLRATGDAPTMPPAGGPTAAERARLLAWMDCETGG